MVEGATSASTSYAVKVLRLGMPTWPCRDGKSYGRVAHDLWGQLAWASLSTSHTVSGPMKEPAVDHRLNSTFMSIEKLTEVYESLGFRERALFRRCVDLGLLSEVSCDWCHEASDWTKSPNLRADYEGVCSACPTCGKTSVLTWNVLVEEINMSVA